MPTEFLTNISRLLLLDRIASLAGRTGPTPEADLADERLATNPDATVIAACLTFCDLEDRKLALIEGTDRVADDEVRDRMLERVLDQQQACLEAICEHRATTQAGHQARAVCIALWDGGEVAYRARVAGFVDDRLIAALLRDLVRLPW